MHIFVFALSGVLRIAAESAFCEPTMSPLPSSKVWGEGIEEGGFAMVCGSGLKYGSAVPYLGICVVIYFQFELVASQLDVHENGCSSPSKP